MKREYFQMLVIIGFVGLYFITEYFIGEKLVREYTNNYIVVWLLITFQAGQYSMKFPKAF